MTNQQLMGHGNQMMDETDQAIERSKKVSITCMKRNKCLCNVKEYLQFAPT